MITKMKKLTFLVYHKEYEEFLEKLRDLGVVHIVEKQWGEMDDSLQTILRKQALYKGVLQSMHFLADKQPDGQIHEELAPDVLMQQYDELKNRIHQLEQQTSAIGKEIAQMEVWGDFDWESVRKLEAAGWHVNHSPGRVTCTHLPAVLLNILYQAGPFSSTNKKMCYVY